MKHQYFQERSKTRSFKTLDIEWEMVMSSYNTPKKPSRIQNRWSISLIYPHILFKKITFIANFQVMDDINMQEYNYPHAMRSLSSIFLEFLFTNPA